MGASSSRRLGWWRKISLEWKQSFLISDSDSCTCFPGLPLTSSNRLIISSKAAESIWFILSSSFNQNPGRVRIVLSAILYSFENGIATPRKMAVGRFQPMNYFKFWSIEFVNPNNAKEGRSIKNYDVYKSYRELMLPKVCLILNSIKMYTSTLIFYFVISNSSI